MSLDSRRRRRWPWLAAAAAIALIAGAIALGARRPRTPGHIVVPVSAEALPAPDPNVLRVCADPNNLPFSNARGEGFENRLATLIAHELGKRLDYYWQPQRRGFIRTTLAAGRCDVVIGVPSQFDMTRRTRPYYRSTYVFVSQRARRLHVRSFDDPRLRRFRIGVQLTGDDYDNPPAAQALAARQIVDNVHGYMVYGDYSQPNPLAPVIDAVARGDVDVAIAWGPTAGYFARRASTPLELTPVTPAFDRPSLPFVFDISMGVRRTDRALARRLDAVIARRGAEIRRILEQFGVPLVGPTPVSEARGPDAS